MFYLSVMLRPISPDHTTKARSHAVLAAVSAATVRGLCCILSGRFNYLSPTMGGYVWFCAVFLTTLFVSLFLYLFVSFFSKFLFGITRPLLERELAYQI